MDSALGANTRMLRCVSEMQHRLEAIFRIQTRKREWICASLIKRVWRRIEGRRSCHVSSRMTGWAPDVFRASSEGDPVFQRMFADARSRQHRRLACRSDHATQSWQSGLRRAARQRTATIIDAIATEHFQGNELC